MIGAGIASTPQAQAFDWTGFYIGGHSGYGSGDENDNQSQYFSGPTGPSPGGTSTATTTNVTGPGPILDHLNLNGFMGGVHAGFDYQIDEFIFGVEGDVDYADIERSQNGVYHSGHDLRRLTFESRWQESLRLRAGFTPFDRVAVFATGGLAIAEGKLSNSGTHFGIPIPSTTAKNTHTGWTAGIGAAYALTNNWVGEVTVRYSDFGSEAYPTDDGPVTVDWTQVTASIGIGYKF